ncbi:alkaline phosphatase family protein [Nocardioides sp. MH1]|uniref:alkaline phosphatase family protein n=1 Tax=Nocardioides sp. MH1 TaxID=3242490 RepID=UPI003521622B
MRAVIRGAVAVVLLLAMGAAPAAPPAGARPPAADRTTDHTVTKVMVIVVENHSLRQMQRQMPRTFAFASQYAYATDYRAIRHPSLPNYIAMVAGSTLSVTDDHDPSAHHLRGATVFSQARANGRTAKTYADAMPSRCALQSSGDYAVRHNPWTYFVDDRRACLRHDVPVTALRRDARRGHLPNVGFLIPDLVHDAHDASLADADAWISRRIGQLTAGPDWTSGHLAIVVTADEDDRLSGNKVLTLVGSRYQDQRVVTEHLTHYSLTRFIEDVLGVHHLRHARRAPDMTAAFGVQVG